MSEDATIKVFVYGTLRVGRFYAVLLDNFRVSCEDAQIVGTMYDAGMFPAVVETGEGTVTGELHVYKDPNKVKLIMDQIEGYRSHDEEGSLYIRREVDVRTRKGEIEKASVYFFNQSVKHFDRIESGCWKL